MVRRALFHLCHCLLWPLIRYWFRLSITGAENLPAQGGFILAANHSSHLDTALTFHVLGRRKHRLWVLAAEDYFFRSRLLPWLVTTLFHAVPVARERFSPELLERARQVLARGDLMLMYPEGGRTAGAAISPFKSGVGYLACNLDVPVVPVCIEGTDRAYPKGAFWPRPAPVVVRIGAPLLPAEGAGGGESGNGRYKEFTRAVENSVRQLGERGWAVVTGASSGAGEAISEGLARRGWNLLLVARREDALERLAARLAPAHGVEVRCLPTDLAEPDDRRRLLDELTRLERPVEVLVNNAGIGANGRAGEADAARHGQLIRLNCEAPVALADALLSTMRRRGRGHIINIGSVYSLVPVPEQSVYAASKAFLHSWSRALQRELVDSGVHLCLAMPGSFTSGFHRSQGLQERRPLGKMPAERVAEQVLDAAFRGRRTVVPGLANKCFLACCACLPAAGRARLIQLINRIRGV